MAFSDGIGKGFHAKRRKVPTALGTKLNTKCLMPRRVGAKSAKGIEGSMDEMNFGEVYTAKIKRNG